MEKSRFFYRILLPSMGAIVLFLASMYLFVIPVYRENLMDKKRETIRELTNTAWSVLENLHQKSTDSASVAMLQMEAITIVEHMRYGPEQKDYFWITDTLPRMVMHPYRPQLNGKDLSQYADAEGKRFFVEITQLVSETGDGYIDYKWQWKDDSLMVVPKLSYVKLYEPWGWIIGTGIYVEDVEREIGAVTRKLVWISLFITIIIGLIIAYLARRNYLAEQHEKQARQRQREAMEKYKKLVEASSDGVLMTMNSEIVYCNPFLISMMGYSPNETHENNESLVNSLNCFFQIKSQGKEPATAEEGSEIVKEQKYKKKNGETVDVIITRSKFDIEEKKGYIYTVKDVSRHKDVERELDLSMEKFKSIADMMNLGIFRCTMGRQARFVEMNRKALRLLGYNSLQELQDMQVQDLFSDRDERKEVLRAVSESLSIKDRLLHILKSDGTIIPVLVSLFPVKDLHDRSVFCDGILLDAYEHLSRGTGFGDPPVQFSASVLLRPVKDFLLIPPMCDLDTPCNTASRLMGMKDADLALVGTPQNEIIGLITHSDISRRVVAKGLDAATPVGQVMSSPVVAVSDQEMVADAFSLMLEHRVSYVAVHKGDRRYYGYISLLAMSELRRNTPEYLIHAIQKAQSTAEVTELMRQLPRLIESLMETGTGASTAGKLISRISDSVTIRFITDAIQQLGHPPCPWVFIALGSEGRREQTLATDQDNAIVFLPPNTENSQAEKEYFLELGNRVCAQLDEVGYPFCQGGVMAMNPKWCLNLAEIQQQVTRWINTPNPEELLNTGIFFDFRPVEGDFNLATELQKFCLDQARDKGIFLYNLAQNTINIRIRSTVPARTAADRREDYLDIKEPLMAITSIVRLWALKFGVGEKNTLERLLALQTMNLLPQTFTDEFGQAHRFLTQLRIKNQLQEIAMGTSPDNLVAPGSLTDMDRIMLKKITSAITNHQARLATEFRVG